MVNWKWSMIWKCKSMTKICECRNWKNEFDLGSRSRDTARRLLVCFSSEIQYVHIEYKSVGKDGEESTAVDVHPIHCVPYGARSSAQELKLMENKERPRMNVIEGAQNEKTVTVLFTWERDHHRPVYTVLSLPVWQNETPIPFGGSINISARSVTWK